MKTDVAIYENVLSSVPDRISDSEILNILHTKEINWEYINTIKGLTNLTDKTISIWLNISVRSFKSYRHPNIRFKENIKEHIIVLLSLIKHGINVFGSKESFDKWLISDNFLLDSKAPATFLNSVTGVRFIDDRVTAIEYGDNV